MAGQAVSEDAVRTAQELVVVFSRLRRQLREVADLQGLTPSQTSVLSRLSKGEPTSASALAAAERVRPQSMAATLSVLDERGLIRRKPDPGDGRRQLISLSAAGRSFLSGNRQARAEWLARAMQERYTDDERQAVLATIKLLERLGQP